MKTVQIVGIILIILSYITTWFLIIKSKNIIEDISKKGLRTLREIEEQLNL